MLLAVAVQGLYGGFYQAGAAVVAAVYYFIGQLGYAAKVQAVFATGYYQQLVTFMQLHFSTEILEYKGNGFAKVPI